MVKSRFRGAFILALAVFLGVVVGVVAQAGLLRPYGFGAGATANTNYILDPVTSDILADPVNSQRLTAPSVGNCFYLIDPTGTNYVLDPTGTNYIVVGPGC